jgi:3-oxoacyl-[acyl-carrier-protein] synthase II
MTKDREVVLTGQGVVSPIGIGTDAYWESLLAGKSGVVRIDLFAGNDLPVPIGGVISDFDPKKMVKPRKSLKVMSRDIQLAYVAADLAYQDAGLEVGQLDPDRSGVVFGSDMIAADLDELRPAFATVMENGYVHFERWGDEAMAQMYPLWMLKYLPNMPACHIGITKDARGPSNSVTQGEASALLAISEAYHIIQRGAADMMIAGGTASRVHPTMWAYGRSYALSKRTAVPHEASRPFDAGRDGMVHGEGAGAFVLENRESAEARGAKILAVVEGVANFCDATKPGTPSNGNAIRNVLKSLLDQGKIAADQVAHLNAEGLSTVEDDRVEASAIADVLGQVPVTAPKSYFGNLGGGAGAVELVASLLGLQKELVPPTLNYTTPDPTCPINVVHGEPLAQANPYAIAINHLRSARCVGLLLKRA